MGLKDAAAGALLPANISGSRKDRYLTTSFIWKWWIVQTMV